MGVVGCHSLLEWLVGTVYWSGWVPQFIGVAGCHSLLEWLGATVYWSGWMTQLIGVVGWHSLLEWLGATVYWSGWVPQFIGVAGCHSLLEWLVAQFIGVMRICWFPGVLVLMVNFALVDVAINPAPARDKCLSYESKYVTEHRACDCVVYQSYGLSRGNFHSPNYPQVYDRGIECILFTFIGDVDERVELTFVEFDLKWKEPGAEK
ncbi:uncharacterized protein LOC117328393 [Pecten maximus]|uniref:uncharacterized protein LOC117328393 n=1 Tax=Pecten maximus TaxID=6579 RepID=UPI001458FE5C|nr:uncharacterized protein LOC117328393 [Pecten maximus]